jgi:hypothetical protein
MSFLHKVLSVTLMPGLSYFTKCVLYNIALPHEKHKLGVRGQVLRILWHADPLLGNDCKINIYTMDLYIHSPIRLRGVEFN